MSFRTRLTLFFVLIVIVPMVSVTFVLFRLIADNENGKADARVAARQETAINLALEARDRRRRGRARRSGRDPRPGDGAARPTTAPRPLRRGQGAAQAAWTPSASCSSATGSVLADVGARHRRRSRHAPARRDDRCGVGDPAGLRHSDAPDYARLVRRVTGQEVVVRRGRPRPGRDSRRFRARRDAAGRAMRTT